MAESRGDGRWCRYDDDHSNYTVELTDCRKANLGVGTGWLADRTRASFNQQLTAYMNEMKSSANIVLNQ